MRAREIIMKIIFLLCACVSIIAVAAICLFMFMNGFPAIKEIGVGEFLLGTEWRPGQNLFGIFPMIVGSIYVTAGAIIFGVPVGILTAIIETQAQSRNIIFIIISLALIKTSRFFMFQKSLYLQIKPPAFGGRFNFTFRIYFLYYFISDQSVVSPR